MKILYPISFFILSGVSAYLASIMTTGFVGVWIVFHALVTGIITAVLFIAVVTGKL